MIKNFNSLGGRFADAFAKEAVSGGAVDLFGGNVQTRRSGILYQRPVHRPQTDNLIEPEFITRGDVEIRAGDQVLDEIMIFNGR